MYYKEKSMSKHDDYKTIGFYPMSYADEDRIESMIRAHGVEGTRKIIQKQIAEKEKLKKKDWKKYKSRYCGRVR